MKDTLQKLLVQFVELLRLAKQTKTGLLASGTIAGAVTGYLNHQLSFFQSLSIIAAALAVFFLRHAMEKIINQINEIGMQQGEKEKLVDPEILLSLVNDGSTLIEDLAAGKIDKTEAEKRALETLLSFAGKAASKAQAQAEKAAEVGGDV